MASRRLYIGNLSYTTDLEGMKAAFSAYGEIKDSRIITDRETGKSRGFGFIQFGTVEEAQAAINRMNGQDLDGRRLVVNETEEREKGGGGGGNRSSSGPRRDYNSNNSPGGGYSNEGSGGRKSYDKKRRNSRDEDWS